MRNFDYFVYIIPRIRLAYLVSFAVSKVKTFSFSLIFPEITFIDNGIVDFINQYLSFKSDDIGEDLSSGIAYLNISLGISYLKEFQVLFFCLLHNF